MFLVYLLVFINKRLKEDMEEAKYPADRINIRTCGNGWIIDCELFFHTPVEAVLFILKNLKTPAFVDKNQLENLKFLEKIITGG